MTIASLWPSLSRAEDAVLGVEFLSITNPGNPGDRFGAAFAGLPDFDGDANPDLAIGAFGFPRGTSFGRVLMYRAGRSLDTVHDWEDAGRVANELFGYSLAGARDLNGDGWSDLVVGDPRGNGAASLSGVAFIYFGGPQADTLADVRLSGVEANQQFGIKVACPGDVNRDGFDDVLVGAYNPVSLRGTVSLFLGGAAFDTIPDRVIHSTQLRDNLGYAISGGEDVNSDGFPDFLVGQALWSATTPSRQEGRVLLFLGGANPDTLADLACKGAGTNQHVGQWVSVAGDVNGDGAADILCGDTNRQAFLAFGGAPMDSVFDVTLDDAISGAGVGDINGDGYDDIAVGSRERANVYLGGSVPDAVVDFQYSRAGLAGGSDGVVARVGDLDLDGIEDLAIGFPLEGSSGNQRGGIHVLRLRRYVLISPNGGEQWSAGTIQPIRWAGTDSARVEVSFDGGTNWRTLATGAKAGTGELRVELPDTLAGGVLLRVGPPGGSARPGDYDASDGGFSLNAFKVTKPEINGLWIVGQRDSIEWSGSRLADVFLSARDGSNPVRLASDVGGQASNKLVFDVPLVNSDSVAGRVQVAGTNGAGPLGDDSPGYFKVLTYVLVEPNGGEQWGSGELEAVRWRGSTRASIQLSMNDGATWTTLASDVGGAPDNELEIRLPRVSSSTARVRVLAFGQPANPSRLDESDAVFGISEHSQIPNLPVKTVMSVLSPESHASFGAVAESVGDLNADGYEDLAIGSWQADQGDIVDAGRVFVFYGGPDADDVPDQILEGPPEGARFGYAIAKAGDLDGDGFDDLLVGAPNAAAGRGAVYAYRGGPRFDSIADREYTGASSQINFGVSIAGCGDTNGDGFADFAVGVAPRAGTSTGYFVPVFYGGQELLTVVARKLVSPASSDRGFGLFVAPAGDWTGDGVSDFLVQRVAVSVADSTSWVYVYPGGTSGTLPVYEFRGKKTESFGRSFDPTNPMRSFRGIGDFDGDGRDDVAIGIPYSGFGGRVRVYLGGSHTHQSFTLETGAETEQFGTSLDGGADVNGDGFADLVIGATRRDGGGFDYGGAYVFYGGYLPAREPALAFGGFHSLSYTGAAVALVPGFLEPAFATIAVGAWNDGRAGTAAGAFSAYALDRPHLLAPLGGVTWLAGEPAQIRWRGVQRVNVELSLDQGENWTTLASNAGGALDNQLDLQAPEASTVGASVRVTIDGYLSYRSTCDETQGAFRIAPRSRAVPGAMRAIEPSTRIAELRARARVVDAGDVDGDGRADLLVSTEKDGVACVELWLEREDGVALRWTPPAAHEGVALAAAGDLNGDGFGDFLFGLPGEDGAGMDAGAVEVFFGGAEPDAVRDLLIPGGAAGDRFGSSLASADLDGNGTSDVLVGAPCTASPATRAGYAQVFLGGFALDAFADATLRSLVPGDEFGAAVAIAGDMNHDGCGDLAIGAPGLDSLGHDVGRVFVFCGGGGASSSPDLVLVGRSNGDRFGATLARAGDANGDGFPDLLVGAPTADAGEGESAIVDAGSASIYFGGGALDATSDWTAFGTVAGAQLGSALDGGVDVNADGFDDWLLGAPFAGVAERGVASLFFGGVVPDTAADSEWSGLAPLDRAGDAVLLARDAGVSHSRVLIGVPGAIAREGGCVLREFAADRWWLEPLAPRWPVSAQREIRWSGAEPADVWLVRDGASPLKLASAAGGARENTLAITVPAPAGSARIRLTPAASGVSGLAESEAIVITSTVMLGSFAATRVPGEGIVLSWTTTPNVADGGVASYRIYRAPPGFPIGERIADGISGTSVAYAEKVRGARYTLAAVSAAGEELVLGETSLEAAPVGLRVYPVPVRSGDAVVELAPPLGADGRTAADFELSVYDVSGRKVETLARGSVQTDIGVLRLSWSGRDREGNRVKAGLYFVRAESRSAGFRLDRRVVLTR